MVGECSACDGLVGLLDRVSRALIRCDIPDETPSFLSIGGDTSGGLTDLGCERETARGACEVEICGDSVLRSSVLVVSIGLETLRGFVKISVLCSLLGRGNSGAIGDLETRIGFAS